MTRGPAAARDADRGETLVELLITVMVIGMSVSAVLGAVVAGVDAASLGRKQADAKTFLRVWAEGIERSGWTSSCATESAVTAAAPQTSGGVVAYPDGVGGTAPEAVTVTTREWTGSAWATCSGTPSDLQEITLRVQVRTGVFPAGSQSLAVVVRKP